MSTGGKLYRLLLLVALVGLVFASADTPVVAGDDDELDLPDDSLIVFSSLNRAGGNPTGFDIWTMDPADPTVLTQLTDFPGGERFPRWSPDGSQIAFSRDFNSIWVMDADGGNPTQVATTSEVPNFWSHDGDRIYFAVRNQGFFGVDVNGPPTQTGVFVTGSQPYVQGDISPDGSRLTFKGAATFDKTVRLGDFDGSALTNVSTLFAGSTGGDVCSGGTRETVLPAWSPDNTRIAFGRDTADFIQDPHTILLDGTGCLAVTDLSASANNPRWSPDSEWLVFSVSFLRGTVVDDEIYIARADGSSAPINLTNDNIGDQLPDWSPELDIDDDDDADDDDAQPTTIGFAYIPGPDGLEDPYSLSLRAGAEEAEETLGVVLEERAPSSFAAADIRAAVDELTEKSDLVVGLTFLYDPALSDAAAANPGTNYVVLDLKFPQPSPANLLSVLFATNEGAFLAGAAAALTSETGGVGFIGAIEIPTIQSFEKGFEAGALYVNPAAVVEIVYLSEFPDFSGFMDPVAGYNAATAMYQGGVDVIEHAAGGSGSGVFDAARDFSVVSGTHVWAIGVDVDQYQSVSPSVQPHILTSVLKKYDTVALDIIFSQLSGTFTAGVDTYGLDRGGVDYSRSGGFLDAHIATLEQIRLDIIDGLITVPVVPIP